MVRSLSYPSADTVDTGDGSLSAFDVLDSPRPIGRLEELDQASFGLAIEGLGLTEPTCINVGEGAPNAHANLIVELYRFYVRDQTMPADWLRLMASLTSAIPILAPGVVPDSANRHDGYRAMLLAEHFMGRIAWPVQTAEQCADGETHNCRNQVSGSLCNERRRRPAKRHPPRVLLDPDRTAGANGKSVLELERQ